MKHIVPLGANCTISHHLRRTNQRTHALPFDWNWSPMQSTIALLENDFTDFLNEENLMFLPQHKQQLFDDDGRTLITTETILTPCICLQYNILFTHDFSAAGIGDLTKVKEKYNRRINRLRSILSSKNEIIFIACDRQLHPLPELQDDVHLGHTDWYSLAGRTFNNQFIRWKERFNEMMNSKYSHARYQLYDLEEFIEL